MNLKKYLEKLSKIDINLNSEIKILDGGEKIVNTAIFKKSFFSEYNENLDKYKIAFFLSLAEKEIKILKIKLGVEIDFEKAKLFEYEKDILYSEINSKLAQIHFLKDTFNIEAEKVDKKFIFVFKKVDYVHYNRIFFGISKIKSTKHIIPNQCKFYPANISKKQLQELLKYSRSINKKLKFKFGKYINFSFNGGYIKITDKKNYNLQNIISIFFHEATHFFRHTNGVENFGFNYKFTDYTTLEEGISLYNEYKYGNKITDYGKFISYYDICFNTLTSNITEDEKKAEIYKILKCKGYNRKKSLGYYYRFHRYSKFRGENFYLKDLIYSDAYDNVVKLIKKDSYNYNIIMSGKIGLNEIKKNLYIEKGNEPSQAYFNKMVEKINSYGFDVNKNNIN